MIDGRNEKGSKFLSRTWQPCKSDREVTVWIEKFTLSKKNKERLSGWCTHVQNWHSSLSASEQARLDNVLVEWGLPVRDVSKLKAHSLLRLLSVATVLVARLQQRLDWREVGCARAGLKTSSFWWRQNRDIPLLISGAHLLLQSLYFEPVRFGAQVMNNVLWLRGKFLLFAYEMDMCKSPLLQKF